VTIRRIEITVESSEILLIRQRGRLPRRWCSRCRSSVAAVSFSDVTLYGLSTEVIQKQERADGFHLIEAVDSVPLICLASLIRMLKEILR
jgi:hypothetical protein